MEEPEAEVTRRQLLFCFHPSRAGTRWQPKFHLSHPIMAASIGKKRKTFQSPLAHFSSLFIGRTGSHAHFSTNHWQRDKIATMNCFGSGWGHTVLSNLCERPILLLGRKEQYGIGQAARRLLSSLGLGFVCRMRDGLGGQQGSFWLYLGMCFPTLGLMRPLLHGATAVP